MTLALHVTLRVSGSDTVHVFGADIELRALALDRIERRKEMATHSIMVPCVGTIAGRR